MFYSTFLFLDVFFVQAKKKFVFENGMSAAVTEGILREVQSLDTDTYKNNQ